MAYVDNTMIIRRDLLAKMAELFNEEKLVSDIDRVPLIMAPRNRAKTDRCCVFKERVIIKEKFIPLLGFELKEDRDELKTLAEYAKEALVREKPIEKILTVVDEACTSCVKNSYIVTNLCKGCVAHPCMMNCPKEAISWNANGQAQINPETCVNCGICMSVCPYHSIIFMPVPCENACPVGAISKNEYGIEHIDEEKCIDCGKCITACPFGSIMENSQIIDVMKSLKSEQETIALVAPALYGQFKYNTENVIGAIKELGFKDVIEVAKGANTTTINEANELLERLENNDPFMTTSCCPAYVSAVKKHIPEMEKYVSHTKSPMYYTAELAKEQYPNAKFVFIGPCIAKRREGMSDPNIDLVMTFEELSGLFTGWNININGDAIELDRSIKDHGRAYAASGGVAQSVLEVKPYVNIKPVIVDGLDKKKINMLKAFAKTGKTSGNFIEVMACEGGCIAGPSSNYDAKTGMKIYQNSLKKFKEN
ncbi:monomeric [FeFe] hydrogenase [Ancylomarina sp. 16SWW S1-10-2]|uniref:monomeric [FeFe] hydrogenase n=1 Tax=Ancylomarina sp. 16SWW S1-10-2 TaxID=2499681 RepID=UPI0012AE0174|nr:monomeric [FeFe] hydrogenase [Ancylomarina sp. 16SWW S1-10-2]MRT91392.1 4Fe-4S dicluster domain-containing protein [Ancylomarina sp. 16SWW S1-10-2]